MQVIDLPAQFPRAHYSVTVPWDSVESTIDRLTKMGNPKEFLDLDPDFQRGHVWTRDQQIAYVDFILLGGEASSTLTFNCPGWMKDFRGPYTIVDGKQRLEAVRSFMRGEYRVLAGHGGRVEGWLVSEIHLPYFANFDWRVHALDDREQVLRLYLGMNRGGTPHTEEEIRKVEGMLK
jgi:hypothetical protein